MASISGGGGGGGLRLAGLQPLGEPLAAVVTSEEVSQYNKPLRRKTAADSLRTTAAAVKCMFVVLNFDEHLYYLRATCCLRVYGYANLSENIRNI